MGHREDFWEEGRREDFWEEVAPSGVPGLLPALLEVLPKVLAQPAQ